VIHYAQAEHFI